MSLLNVVDKQKAIDEKLKSCEKENKDNQLQHNNMSLAQDSLIKIIPL